MTLSLAPVDIRYNGFQFPLETETQACDVRPVYDPAGRVVSHTIYDFTIRSIIRGNAGQTVPTDTAMTDLRRRLTAPARPFEYRSVGLGDIRVNVVGQPVRDALWGPKPQLLRWSPKGQLACEIVWQVQVAIPECDPATYAFAPMEFNFKLDWSIDNGGYTRRTYSGHLRIPQTRRADAPRLLSDNADAYRDRVVPPVPTGFRRQSQTYTLSDDKCRLDFSVVDEEHPSTNYPPPGVTLVSASHETGTDSALAGVRGEGTISATYEVARDRNRAEAYRHFLDLVSDRARNIAVSPVVTFSGAVSPGFFLPISFRASEPEIYGRRHATFSLQYTCSYSMRTIVSASGLWRPVPGNSWGLWLLSLRQTAYNNRGNARLSFPNSGDALIDLCETPPASLVPEVQLSATPPPLIVADAFDAEAFRPRPETSWLAFDSRLVIGQVDDTHTLKLLPTAPIELQQLPTIAQPPQGPGGLFQGVGSSGAERGARPAEPQRAAGLPVQRVAIMSTYPPPASPDRVVQVRSRPAMEVTLAGYAARAGYPIQPPALKQVGDALATPANRRGDGFTQWVGAVWLGVPVYHARWQLRYTLDRVPTTGEVPVMDDPLRT